MKYELISKTLNPLRNIFWYIVPGTTVSWVLSGEQMYPPLYYFDYLFEEAVGAWLTANVGRQGIHWDWRYATADELDHYKISVKIIKSRQHLSSMLLLRWA